MSGIVAYFDRNGGIDREAAETMLEQLAHRGPDGEGLWLDGQIGIGHQDHKTTPESAFDDQPWCEKECVIAGDIRLDNRPELLAALSVSEQPAQLPDSQLVLAAYREWGDACVERLVGAFAFVIWDQREETVFCARDHFGVKPLYYHQTDDVFAVASEPKAILALPSVRDTISETKIGDFLINEFEQKEITFYEEVRRLPPAHSMTVDAEAAPMGQYWDLDPTRTLTLESDAAYERRFRELFERAVADRLRTNDAVGTTLSGGLDSSSITAVANEQLSDTLRTYSGVFDDIDSCDEREYIETLVSRDGIEPTYVIVDRLSLLDEMEAVLSAHDEPIINTMHYMKWEINRQAADDGVGVILDGAHGDSAVDYGLGLLPQWTLTGRWWRLTGELRQMGEVLDVPARQLFKQQVLPWVVPEPIKRGWQQLQKKPTDAKRANATLSPAFIDRANLDTRYRQQKAIAVGTVRSRSARQWQYRALKTGAITGFLEENDIASAAFGVEPRYPFIDKRLIEFTLAIPPTQQLADGWTRSILRRSLDDYLPEAIQWRPWKTLLNPAFQHALAGENETLSQLIDEPGPLTQYLEPKALRESYVRFTETPNARDQRVLWKALSLATWLEYTGTRTRPTLKSREVARDMGP